MAGKCIFCKIVQGLAPKQSLYETRTILAFLDNNPVNPGHVLVIPKEHFSTVFDVPPALGADVLEAVQIVGKAVMLATKADGLNVFQNNFRTAGQRVDHAHWHLVPRFEGDGHRLWPQRPYDSQEVMERMAQAIREYL